MKIIITVLRRFHSYYIRNMVSLRHRLKRFRYETMRDLWIILEILHPVKLITAILEMKNLAAKKEHAPFDKENNNEPSNKRESEMENNAETDRTPSENDTTFLERSDVARRRPEGIEGSEEPID